MPYESSSAALSAYENQNAGRECQKPSHYYRNSDCVDERTDSDEDQVDCQQEHSKIFCDSHGLFLGQTRRFCTLKNRLSIGMIKSGRRGIVVATFLWFVNTYHLL
jgi:hypothetical protein